MFINRLCDDLENSIEGASNDLLNFGTGLLVKPPWDLHALYPPEPHE